MDRRKWIRRGGTPACVCWPAASRSSPACAARAWAPVWSSRCAPTSVSPPDTEFALTASRAAALDAERLLAEAVGTAQARYLLLTGERIEAPEALRIGLVTRVVPDAELSDTVADLARQLADGDADTLRACKQAIARLTR